MSHHTIPHRTPDKAWLLRALEGVDGKCLDTPEQRADVADHILGNWMTIEDSWELRDIPRTNEISAFLHCGKCLREKPPGLSPREWASLEVGYTPQGLQIWCERHEVNVLHLDFMGQRMRAESRA
ncbi:MAG: hypothetical protein Q8R28_11435 [Dehalococcoidia bacterium]|nr:hypothetical protein [Dehalococcoidia bacterium]